MPLPTPSSAAIRAAVQRVHKSPRARRWAKRALASLVIFGIVLWFGGPPLIRHFAQHQLSQLLKRPVTVGRITLNPYTLRLEVDQLRIGEPGEQRAGTQPLLSLDKLVVRPSWFSLLRLKPIVGELYLEGPVIHLVRTGAQRFNFSDLIDTFDTPASPGSQPLRFSVSNIRLENGRIDFDDEVLGTHHNVDQWRVGIPFIANLPSSTDIFVQPLLQARIDGSVWRLTGATKPFSNSLESSLELQIDQFDLTRLLPYIPYVAPHGLPVRMQSGWLSTHLNLLFAKTDGEPQVKLSGSLDVRDLALTDAATAPLFKVQQLHVEASDIEPLRSVVHLAQVRIDAPELALSRDAHGALNLLQLAGASPTSGDATQTTSSSGDVNPAADVSIQHVVLANGALDFSDHSVAQTAPLTLNRINFDLSNFSTLQHGAARFTAQLDLPHEGTISGSGSVDLPGHQAQVQVNAKQLDLAQLQPWLDGMLVARLTQGQLGLQATLAADWGGATPALTVSPGQLTLDALQLVDPLDHHVMLGVGHGVAQLQRFDLTSRSIQVSKVDLDQLTVAAERAANGRLDLANLLEPSAGYRPPPARRSVAAPKVRTAAPAWHYQLDAINLTRAHLGWTDRSQAQTVALALAPLQLKISHVSDAFDQPWPFELSGSLNQKGRLTLHGRLSLAPFDLAVHVQAAQLDVAAFEPYFAAQLNASIASALFDANGDIQLGEGTAGWQAGYQGDAGLENVRMLDKQSADLFAGWRRLSVSHIKAHYDHRGTDVDVHRVALSNFYARVFLDASGRLNLRNFIAQPAAPGASLTRTQDVSVAHAGASATTPTVDAAASTDAAASAPEAASASTPLAGQLNLHFGAVLLQHGRINYTDDFIKPNFSTNLVDINGTIGSFGSRTIEPASVAVQASVDGRGPVAISGTLNPLATPPALDMTASAQGIELTNFTPYSTKFAGYPITEGRLNVDLHYVLDHAHLSANNHLFIDQLTFGEHVENTTATHLPVTLAVALLKNSRGQIDVDIPVSGSLSDPQFSLGGLIWHALVNLLEKAVTAPFTLLANAFGANAEQLQYIAFAPGSASVSDAEQHKLASLAQALNDKPGVRLDMVGRADPALDGPALRNLALEQAIRQAKLKQVVGHGQSIEVNQVTVAADEYDKYLKLAYQAADFKKPSNFIGLNKSLPTADMKQLLLEHLPVTDAMLRELAQQRVEAVHQWLDGKVPAGRLYDRSPKLDTQGITDQGATTRVDFILK